MIVVGQYAGTVSMSGVNIGSQVTFIVTNFVMGLTVGATVLVGQYLGAKDKTAVKEVIGTLFCSLFLLAAFFTVVMIAVQDPLLRLIRTPEESYSEAKDYFFVTMLGTIFIFGYNALSAVMRGMGDSKNPMIFVAIACVINVALDFWFVAGLHMQAFGAALATVISQAISMILCILYLVKNKFIFDFKLSSFKIHKDRLKTLLKVGIPTSFQNVATGISFLFLTTIVNSLGFTASAAVGAVSKLNGFAILPAIAMSASISAMCAQNIGAGEIKRAVKTLRVGMLVAAGISFLIFGVVSLFPQQCLAVFGNDEAMIKSGVEYLKTFKYDYIIVPFTFCFNGLFVGAGHTTFSLFNSLISSLIVRIPVGYIFGILMDMGLLGVGLGAPLASFISLLFAIGFFLSGRWKHMVIIKHTKEA